MRHKILILILFIISFESPLFAQNKYNFKQFADETFDFIKQPLKWEGEDYLKFGIVAVGGGLSIFADEPVRDMVLRDQRFNKSAPIEFGRMYGELYSPIILFSGFALYSWIFDDNTAKKIGYEIGQASLYAGAINFGLKVAIGRARPNLYNNTIGSGYYRPFYTFVDGDYHSMPGGHSTAAFTISTILSRNFKSVWLKGLIYLPAILTMTSRVYQGWHWTSDCLIGAAFGYFIGTWVVDKHEKVVKTDIKDTKKNIMQRIHIQPAIFGGTYGMNLNLQLF